MGSARPALFALVLVLLLFWSVLSPTVGQGSAGHLVVSTDYELFGTSDLRGGGHVTWTLTGDKATDLRMKILHMFDEYPTIPRGFTFAFASPGTANHNSRLDATEGVRYTDLLEDLLEASGRGTSAQYVEMYPFDLRDKVSDAATSFNRSTDGLAGTDANATAPVEIRFLFEANITTTEGRVPLATGALVNALYEGFSYLHGLDQPLVRSECESSFDGTGRLVERDREPDPSARTNRATPVAIPYGHRRDRIGILRSRLRRPRPRVVHGRGG